MSKAIIDRLSRVQGQIEAVKKMIEAEETDCLKVMQMMKASTNALKKASEAYIQEYVQTCVQTNMAEPELKAKLEAIIKSAFFL
ncbi:MAG: transcriptional regulator [Candidatus Hydrogenedentota bacterium]|nr:MAG: transcriptional regulator [Candidatus Hydrogenedentota bacterium]